MKNKRSAFIIIALTLALTGCSLTGTSVSQPQEMTHSTVESLSVSDKDKDTSYDEADSSEIVLSDQDPEVTITEGGTYIITGSVSDGMITVEAPEDEDVHLILKDVSISNPDSPAIFIMTADEVYITLEGSVSLDNGGTFTAIGDEEADAVIYSKTDLTINGEGTLSIVSPSGHAIVCKDEMVITGGIFDITSGEDGINTNDSLAITAGTFSIDSGDDAIHTDGIINIDGGEYMIEAAEGLEATVIVINDGTFTINASDDGINAAQKNEELTPYIEINGGSINITMGAGDTDGIDSNGDIVINGGTVDISGQSTIDYDGAAQLNGGTLIINGNETDTIPNQMMGGPGDKGGQMPGDGGEGFPQGDPPSGQKPQGPGGFQG
ncbi:MAG: carbohydrate-binding domain-containing protein [Clostridia bacterium]|nr:carbohydrate-binding domain-containing protein [Clostridia bacterium]